MHLYDFLAPAYDMAFERVYLPYRERALEKLAIARDACVLDLACGTGQNFPLLARLIGSEGHIIGLDISSGMLNRARNRAAKGAGGTKITLIHAPGAKLNREQLIREADVLQVDAIVCSYGLTSIREPEPVFRASWNLLKPGGSCLILDVHAARRTLHARAVEFATRSRFCERAWRALEAASLDFRMDYLDPSAHLFGGRVFAALGMKPPLRNARHVPHHQQGRSAARAL